MEQLSGGTTQHSKQCFNIVVACKKPISNSTEYEFNKKATTILLVLCVANFHSFGERASNRQISTPIDFDGWPFNMFPYNQRKHRERKLNQSISNCVRSKCAKFAVICVWMCKHAYDMDTKANNCQCLYAFCHAFHSTLAYELKVSRALTGKWPVKY